MTIHLCWIAFLKFDNFVKYKYNACVSQKKRKCKKMCFKKSVIKIEEIVSNRRFFIEESNKTAYFYATSFDFSKIFYIGWLANYCKAPLCVDIKSMNKGKPARMFESACSIPNGIKPIKNFEFNWLDETSFAIKADGETIAVVANAFSNEIKVLSKFLTQETCWGIPMKI